MYMHTVFAHVVVFLLVTAAAVLGFTVALELLQCVLADRMGVIVEPMVLAICA